MATAKDFLIGTDSDFVFRNGDFVLADSDNQHVLDIFISAPGDWKEYPTCGVGIETYESSSGQQQQIESIGRVQLTADGFIIENLRAIDVPGTNQFTIKANVSRNL